ncbi:putative TetR-family transcriptional regulator [Mycobacterium sp. MFM001]|uniref:TetR/AcrR family transcriptional regulator n=1 Tax=Mycobacterium sp. MFM001 TaxID=2049453 RepID=UPI000DA4CEFB|nr:TetR/AcrR family transcriptional regulator [Mycobacterium sp. MFM001]GBE64497.1 putative TetR-family transcriptional regulator [Mycobacterium sp. MFM001]
MTQQTELETRDAIVSAAFACFRTRGLSKTTIVDIARQAGVSRSTVYEYFPDKGAVVEACAEAASQRFYRNMAKVVNRGETLEDKLVRAAVFVVQARRVVEPEKYFDQEEVDLLLTKNSAVLLQECGDFIAPFLVAAKLTGEVRKDLDVAAAAEWFARILFSLFTTPSPRIDMHDDSAVAEFVRPFAVRGFIDDRAARTRRAAAG